MVGFFADDVAVPSDHGAVCGHRLERCSQHQFGLFLDGVGEHVHYLGVLRPAGPRLRTSKSHGIPCFLIAVGEAAVGVVEGPSAAGVAGFGVAFALPLEAGHGCLRSVGAGAGIECFQSECDGSRHRVQPLVWCICEF